jgi:SSS family solute:Na+ symporter
MAPLDWIVVATYAGLVLGVGWWANRRQREPEDYLLGGRRLRWWLVGISLVATSFSAASLLGGTAFGYTTGLRWLQLQIGDLLALLVVMAVFLPFFSGLRLTTAYEYLERRFGGRARSVAALLFLAQTVLRASVLVYGAALVLSEMLGWSVEAAILTAAGIAVLYSAFGGLGAVVWTDLVQMIVVLLSVGGCLWIVAGDVPGGIPALLGHARASGRLEAVSLELEPSTPFNLLGSLVPYAVFATSLFGAGQQAVQRFLSVRDVSEARRAALTGWAVGTLALGTCLTLGVALAGWVDLAPDAEGFELEKGDRLLPKFAVERLPAGLTGLLLAAVLAASMSSLDSAVHSMSTVLLVDGIRRVVAGSLSPSRELLLARLGTAGFGVLAIGGAFLAAAKGEATLLETLVTWLGWFAGPLLGLFLLGLLSRRVDEPGALIGLGTAFVGIVAVVLAGGPRDWGFHPLWLAPASCLVTVEVALLVSLVRAPPGRERVAGLTLRSRGGEVGGGEKPESP